ncbi:hypothetical protein MMC22_012087 [Lobaria immixta]|nr:hypothetical protein [Lobaria immixta]
MSANSNNKGVLAAIGGTAGGGSTSERRRSSASSGKYPGLVTQKRNSTDVPGSARKASFVEQKQTPGFIGGLWHSFTKGAGPADKK